MTSTPAAPAASMTASTATEQAADPAGKPGLGPESTLFIRDLTITPHTDGFVVGRTDTGRFVVLPDIGVQAIRCLQTGLSVQDTSRVVTPAGATEPVDVLGFAKSLINLGFAADLHTPELRSTPAGAASEPGRPGVAWAPKPRLRWLFTRPVAVVTAAAAAAAVLLLVTVPTVRPQAYDVFFLSTPARSLAVLTLITYGLAFLHEVAHVYAAAALGVPARLRITRRLYFLTFETNLTGLWALPPRRRVGPLLAGMAFDSTVLLGVLAARAAEFGPDRLLAAIALVELFAIMTQFFVFLRTDIYAVMTALLGCTNLAVTTRLILRRMIGRLSPQQKTILAAARPRDLIVARWYRWVHLAGLALAGWFLITYFLPSTWHMLQWMWTSAISAGPATPDFYEAVVLGIVLLSPRLLTLAVAAREARTRRPAQGRHDGNRAGPVVEVP